MKYLKKFNESIKEDLEDILLELEDLGMETSVGVALSGRHFIQCVAPGFYSLLHTHNVKELESHKFLYWDDIKDCVLRLKAYLGDTFTTASYRIIEVDETGEIGLSNFLELKVSEKAKNSGRIFLITVDYKPKIESAFNESVNKKDIEYLFMDLQDVGFNISIKGDLAPKLDFSKKNIINGQEVGNFSYAWLRDNGGIKVINVVIENPKTDSGTIKEFNTNDIKETLLFIESYCSELGLQIEYIYVWASVYSTSDLESYKAARKSPYIYYKSTEYLPENKSVDKITISFIEI